jgi:hypothetical protein
MYIISYYLISPAVNSSSSQLNFWQNPANLIANEIVSIVRARTLKNRDLKRANLILDLNNKTVLKCRTYQLDGAIVTEPDYDSLLASLRGTYPEQIDMALAVAKIESELTK